MRYLYLIIKLFVAVLLAKYASDLVAGGQFIYVVLLFAVSSAFVLSSSNKKMILFVFMILFPFTFGRTFPLPMKTWVELMAPVLGVFFILDALRNGQSLVSRKASIYFAAIGVFALWSVVHYIYNPVLGRATFGAELQTGGLRNYYIIFAGIMTFLCGFWFFKNNKFTEKNVDKVLLISLILCVVIGNLYVIGFFSYNVPLIGHFGLGSHDVTVEGRQFSSLPLRQMATMGVALLLCVYHKKKWNFYFLLIALNLSIFLVLGGGRANLLAIFTLIIAYIALVNKRLILPAIAGFLVLAGIYTIFITNISLDTISEAKYGRAFAHQGGLEKQSEERYYTYLYMFEIFQQAPLFGKGIGYKEISLQEDFFKEHVEARKYAEYIKLQSMLGGHGAYLSVLSVFGIGGAFWFIVMLFGSIYFSYRIVKKPGEFDADRRIALFALLYLIGISVGFTIGGNGYENMRLWFIAGIIAGIKSKDFRGSEAALTGR